jgi:hypothetical protein
MCQFWIQANNSRPQVAEKNANRVEEGIGALFANTYDLYSLEFITYQPMWSMSYLCSYSIMVH